MDIIKVAKKTIRSHCRRARRNRLPTPVCTLIGAVLGAGTCYAAFLLGLLGQLTSLWQ